MSEQDDEALVRAFTAPLDRLDNFQCRVSRAEGYVRFGVSVDSVTAPIAAVANAIREAAKQHITSEPAAPRRDTDVAWPVPRHPTEAMMLAGLYHCSPDMKWADLFTAFHSMVDAAPDPEPAAMGEQQLRVRAALASMPVDEPEPAAIPVPKPINQHLLAALVPFATAHASGTVPTLHDLEYAAIAVQRAKNEYMAEPTASVSVPTPDARNIIAKRLCCGDEECHRPGTDPCPTASQICGTEADAILALLARSQDGRRG